MLKLLESLGVSKSGAIAQQELGPYTRFNTHAAARSEQSRDRSLTRFGLSAEQVLPSDSELIKLVEAERKLTSAKKGTPPAPAPAVKDKPAPLNEAAHLHASNQVPLWIFAKALPLRFATMSQGADEFVFH